MRRTIAAILFSTILIASCAAPGAAPSRTWVGPTAGPSGEWELVKIASIRPGGFATPSAIAAGAGRLVAVGGMVGTDPGNEGASYGPVWTSIDGLTWQPADSLPFLGTGVVLPSSGPIPGLFDVAHGPGGFVALGYTGTSGEGIRVGLWRSADGSTWDPVEVDPEVFSGARPAAVRAGGPGFVIVGATSDIGGTLAGSPPPRAAVWTSVDGLTWTRVPDQEAFAIGGYIDTMETPGSGGMLDVVATGDGLVAVGQQCGEGTAVVPMGTNAPCRPMIWTSPDAQSWTKVDPEVGDLAGVVPSIAARSGHVVAVGGGWDHPTPARYTLRSTSGEVATWVWTEDASQPGFAGIIAVPGGFVAATHLAAGQFGLSTSTDGARWRGVDGVPQMPVETSIRASDLTVANGRLVVVGWGEAGSPEWEGGWARVGPLESVTPGGD